MVGMPVPPLFWPRGTCQGACWRCWHQGSSSSAIKNMKTQGWSQSPSTCAANSSPTLLPATHFLPLYDCLSHTRTPTHRKMDWLHPDHQEKLIPKQRQKSYGLTRKKYGPKTNSHSLRPLPAEKRIFSYKTNKQINGIELYWVPQINDTGFQYLRNLCWTPAESRKRNRTILGSTN